MFRFVTNAAFRGSSFLFQIVLSLLLLRGASFAVAGLLEVALRALELEFLLDAPGLSAVLTFHLGVFVTWSSRAVVRSVQPHVAPGFCELGVGALRRLGPWVVLGGAILLGLGFG